MKMQEHKGEVIGVEGGEAIVRLEANESCGSYLRCSCCAWSAREPRVIRVPHGDLAQGDAVRVLIPAYVGYLSVLLVFVLPVALFVAGLMVGGQFEDGSGAHGMPTVIGGIFGFALAVLLAVLANRRLAAAGSVEVVRIGPEDSSPGEPGGR